MTEDDGSDEKNIRDLTYCELFYIISSDCLKDKCIDTTRYPADDYYHTFPSLSSPSLDCYLRYMRKRATEGLS